MDECAVKIQTVKNTDDTVSVFYIQPDRELAYIKQIAPNSNNWTKSRVWTWTAISFVLKCAATTDWNYLLSGRSIMSSHKTFKQNLEAHSGVKKKNSTSMRYNLR